MSKEAYRELVNYKMNSIITYDEHTDWVKRIDDYYSNGLITEEEKKELIVYAGMQYSIDRRGEEQPENEVELAKRIIHDFGYNAMTYKDIVDHIYYKNDLGLVINALKFIQKTYMTLLGPEYNALIRNIENAVNDFVRFDSDNMLTQVRLEKVLDKLHDEGLISDGKYKITKRRISNAKK